MTRHIVYRNHSNTAIVVTESNPEHDHVYSVYSLGSGGKVTEDDIHTKAVCFQCRDKIKAVSLAAFIDHCLV